MAYSIFKISKDLFRALSKRSDSHRFLINTPFVESCDNQEGALALAARIGCTSSTACSVVSSLISIILLVVLMVVSAGPPI